MHAHIYMYEHIHMYALNHSKGKVYKWIGEVSLRKSIITE